MVFVKSICLEEPAARVTHESFIEHKLIT